MSNAQLGGVIFMLQTKLDRMKGEIEPAKREIDSAQFEVEHLQRLQKEMHENLASLERAIGILEGVKHESDI